MYKFEDKYHPMKQLLLFIAILIIAAAMYVGGMLLLGVVTKFKPAAVEKVDTQAPPSAAGANALPSDSTFSFLIWNIGYGGLGKDVDFFYDGGKTVTSPQALVAGYNEGIIKNCAGNYRNIDFVLLQEVDRCSKRSYKIDQAANIAAALPAHYSTFTPNYDVVYLPFPFTDPIGTPLWMAPEQTRPSRITPSVDVWAVGLIAFRLFAGRSTTSTAPLAARRP